MTDKLTATQRRERRKEARPAEIVAAALAEFAENGFGAAKITDIARRAGVSKATVFVYFPTKEDLFRAVARQLVDENFHGGTGQVAVVDVPLSAFIPMLLRQAAHAAQAGDGRVGGIVRMLVAESRAFPDLAKVWHDEVVAVAIGALTAAIARAQARGEVRAGDPRLFAFSIVGPMMAGVIFREVFRDADADLPDLMALAAQHAETILRGLLVKGGR